MGRYGHLRADLPVSPGLPGTAVPGQAGAEGAELAQSTSVPVLSKLLSTGAERAFWEQW